MHANWRPFSSYSKDTFRFVTILSKDTDFVCESNGLKFLVWRCGCGCDLLTRMRRSAIFQYSVPLGYPGAHDGGALSFWKSEATPFLNPQRGYEYTQVGIQAQAVFLLVRLSYWRLIVAFCDGDVDS